MNQVVDPIIQPAPESVQPVDPLDTIRVQYVFYNSISQQHHVNVFTADDKIGTDLIFDGADLTREQVENLASQQGRDALAPLVEVAAVSKALDSMTQILKETIPDDNTRAKVADEMIRAIQTSGDGATLDDVKVAVYESPAILRPAPIDIKPIFDVGVK